MDDKGAVALFRPKVYVCACHNGGDCPRDANSNEFADSNDEKFLIMQCNCINGFTGRFCENDLDACQANLNPCYPGVKCTDLPPPADVFGYQCGPCPYGFSGDGATCSGLRLTATKYSNAVKKYTPVSCVVWFETITFHFTCSFCVFIILS
jgi:hypothetical protein